jgi:hypothetical protein
MQIRSPSNDFSSSDHKAKKNTKFKISTAILRMVTVINRIVAGAQLASRSQRPPRLLLKGKARRRQGKRGTGGKRGDRRVAGCKTPRKREIPRRAGGSTPGEGKQSRNSLLSLSLSRVGSKGWGWGTVERGIAGRDFLPPFRLYRVGLE